MMSGWRGNWSGTARVVKSWRHKEGYCYINGCNSMVSFWVKIRYITMNLSLWNNFNFWIASGEYLIKCGIRVALFNYPVGLERAHWVDFYLHNGMQRQ